MYTKEGHSGMFQRRMGRHSLLVVGQGCGLQPFAACSAAGGQRNSLAQRSGCFCIALCAIARHSLLVVGQGCGLQTIRRLFGGGRAEEQPRSALRLFFASRFARLRGIAAQAKKRQPSRATAAGRHAPFPVSYTIRLPAGSICARNIIPWFCPLRKYKKQG